MFAECFNPFGFVEANSDFASFFCVNDLQRALKSGRTNSRTLCRHVVTTFRKN